MSHDMPQQSQSTTDAPPFPHHLADSPVPLEPAERQYAEPQRGQPSWQPEDGEFS
jgi:hypothetical protein